MTICTTGYGDYIQIGYQREDGSVRGSAFFVPTSIPVEHGLPYSNAGIYFCEPIFIKSSAIDHEIRNLSDDFLGIYGDNGVAIGYKSGNTLKTRLKMHENSPETTGDHIESYGNWNFKGYTLHNLRISNYILMNTFANTRTKTAAETTTVLSEIDDGTRYIYKDVISVDNRIILNIPNKFSGCDYTIVSVVKKGFGDYAVVKEEENRFIIETDREMKMNIEISIDTSNLKNTIKPEEEIEKGE